MKSLAIAFETVGCCAILAGIVVEMITSADIGYVIITSGAMMIALGSMIFAKLIKR